MQHLTVSPLAIKITKLPKGRRIFSILAPDLLLDVRQFSPKTRLINYHKINIFPSDLHWKHSINFKTSTQENGYNRTCEPKDNTSLWVSLRNSLCPQDIGQISCFAWDGQAFHLPPKIILQSAPTLHRSFLVCMVYSMVTPIREHLDHQSRHKGTSVPSWVLLCWDDAMLIHWKT